MLLHKKDTAKKENDWVIIKSSRKELQKSDTYILGHPDIKMPAVLSTSSLKGIKARLVREKPTKVVGPPTSTVDKIVIQEWEFDESNQTRPIHFSTPVHIDSTLWVEMQNNTESDAVVSALIHGMIMSKSL